MFTKGFVKLAWGNVNTPPRMPSAAAAAGVRAGLNKPVGQKLTEGLANAKSEFGKIFGG